jgi:hypothetical protein
MADKMSAMMGDTAMIDKMFLGMANGVDVMAEMAKGNGGPAAKAAMALFFHSFPWHAAGVRRSGLDRISQAAVLLSRHSVHNPII